MAAATATERTPENDFLIPAPKGQAEWRSHICLKPRPGTTMAQTHFGFESVDEREKARQVRAVFDSVAPRYDLMNDLMSGGLHRLWKRYAVAVANVQPGQRVLDLAGGTGDLARAFAPLVQPGGVVVHTDINEAMLREGRERLLDAGVLLSLIHI